jgi:hypothetical protein
MRTLRNVLAFGCLLGGGLAVAQMGFRGEGTMGPGSRGIVTGQPYSLVETTTSVRTLSDGTTMTNVEQNNCMRDAEGRVRIEVGHQHNGTMQFDVVDIVDPVAKERISLMVGKKTARVMQMPEWKSSGDSAGAAKFAAGGANRPGFVAPTVVKLGGQTVAGVYAEGTRTTRVIPVGKEGNDHEIQSVTETWFSPDLRIVVGRTTSDPRFGTTTTVVTNLTRSDPAPALFQVPSDYTVIAPRHSGQGQ